MAYETRNNSGVMFRNDRNPASSKQPEWRGELMIGGAIFEISAWEGRRGRFLSISIQVAGSWRTREQAGS
jgi:hypothetical protein